MRPRPILRSGFLSSISLLQMSVLGHCVVRHDALLVFLQSDYGHARPILSSVLNALARAESRGHSLAVHVVLDSQLHHSSAPYTIVRGRSAHLRSAAAAKRVRSFVHDLQSVFATHGCHDYAVYAGIEMATAAMAQSNSLTATILVRVRSVLFDRSA